jgi:predicted ATPase
MTGLCRGPGGQAIVRVLRRHAPTWLTQMPSIASPAERRALQRHAAGTRERMLRELAEAVEVTAADAALVLWLEDVQWSDPPTVDWLTYLARRPGRARVLVLASCRPFEGLARGHPLDAARDDMTLRGHSREIALGPLDAPSVGEYLARRFPGERALDELAAMVHARTGGHPLFVTNVADDLVRRGVLVERDGRWELEARSGLARIAIPDDVRRMIGRQLDRALPDGRRVLEAASAAGVEFSAAAVAAAADVDLDQVERTRADLAARGSFLVADGFAEWPDGTVAGRYRFRHALYQEIAYDRLPPARRVHLHRRLGDRLEAGLGDRSVESATELAMHFERGRDLVRAIRYLQLAGAIATQRGAAREPSRICAGRSSCSERSRARGTERNW